MIDPDSGRPTPIGDQGELVITTLGRTASPLLRYRTGDLVVANDEPCPCGRTLLRLEGGIQSRIDDMVCVSGVNVYPAAIEAVLMAIGEIVEYRATISSTGALRSVALEVELRPPTPDPDAACRRIASRLQETLALTVPVRAVPAGTLPRFEMKARRVVVVP